MGSGNVQRDRIETVLHTLMTHIDGIEEMVCLQHDDGTVLAQIQRSHYAPQMASIATECLQLTACMASVLRCQDGLETMIKGERRFLALYTVNGQWVLGILARSGINLGLFHRASQRVLEKLQALAAPRPASR